MSWLEFTTENYSAYQEKYCDLLPPTYNAYRNLELKPLLDLHFKLSMRIKYPTGPLPSLPGSIEREMERKESCEASLRLLRKYEDRLEITKRELEELEEECLAGDGLDNLLLWCCAGWLRKIQMKAKQEK